MKKKKNQDQFTGKILKKLWIPAMFSAMGLAFADIADAVVVGQRMGVTGLAAISICLPIYMVLNIFMHSLGQGGSIRFAKLLAEGKREEAVACFNRVMCIGLAISILIAVFGNVFVQPVLSVLGTVPADGALYEACRAYGGIILGGAPAFFFAYMGNYFLISDDNQKLASVGFVVANAIDIVMNILLVLVFDLGAAGAAWATVIGMLVVVVIYLPAFWQKNHFLRFRVCKMDVCEVWGCFRTGFAVGIQYIFQFIFLLTANNLLMRMAGATEVAVFDMLQNASYLILYLYEGARKAMSPLISTYDGEQNREGEWKTLWLAQTWTTAVGFVMIAVFLAAPQLLCSLFGLAGAVEYAVGMKALRIYSLGVVFAGANILLEGYFQACGKEKNAYVLASLRGGVVQLPITFFFAWLGVKYFWWLFPATEISTMIIFFFWKHWKGEKNTGVEPERLFRQTIHNHNEDLAPLMDGVEEFCRHWQASQNQQYFVLMTVEEICAAIIKNGFGEQSDGYIQVTLIALDSGDFELHIRDSAKAFNPFTLELGSDQIDEMNMDAMGMELIRGTAKDFFYRKYQGYNTLIVWI
ncbi:MAG: MATE family efflux transporter [Lachnospiraceae bacterium]|nr:MATE family efflux transporter [bacterium]MDY5517416.1 MATE family efflux transporter [Lachnospiraceae bacterium]